MTRTARRIVTGHDKTGKAIIVSDGVPPKGLFNEISKNAFFEIWNTNAAPALISATESEPTDRPIKIVPRTHGTIIRFVDFHPGGLNKNSAVDAATAQGAFAALGDAKDSTWKADSPHPMMHRTQTIDYGIVLEGEINLILDDSETLVKQGEVVVQRGTNHAWDNRSGKVCRMVFILVDGAFDATLGALFKDHH